jgi:diguanylate cyclase (GGDEF)-like protein/PAS domain S-box-containing protein
MKHSGSDIISYILLLVLGIATLTLNPLQLDTAKHKTIIENIGRLKEQNSNLDRDVLHSDRSLPKHKSSIAAAINALGSSMSSLSKLKLNNIAGMPALLTKLENEIEKKSQIVEQVVADSAQLNNSMHYLPILIEKISSGNSDKLSSAVRKLAIAILEFNNHPAASNEQTINASLTILKSLTPPDTEQKKLEAIIIHAQTILTTRVKVSNNIDALLNIPIEQTLDEITSRYELHHNAAMNSAIQQHYILNLVIFILMAGIAYSIYRIRSSRLDMGIKEERLKHALEGTNNGIWDWNIGENEFYLSPRIEAMLGLSSINTIYRIHDLKKLIHPDDLGKVKNLLKQHLRGETEMFESEHRFKNQYGDWIWTLCCGRVVEQDKKQAPLRMVGIQTDITQRKQTEEELRRNSMVFESVLEAVMICDKENRILAVNEAFTRITGYSRANVIGKDPKLLGSGRHDANFFNNMWDTLTQNGVWQGEIWNRKKSGEIFACWLSIATITNSDDEVEQYISVFSDISQRKEDEELIRFQANYDALTELPNRHLLMERLGFELQRAKREQTLIALMFIDLDRFKPINDTYGHTVGDRLLWEVSKRLSSHVRETDMVARLGGDEFTIILPNIENLDEVERMAGRILHEISRPFQFDGIELFISTSIGITIYPNDATDLPTLLTNADNAMYRAKDEGRNTYRFFTHEMNQHAMEMLQLEGDLHRAQQRDELMPYFQPIVDINSGEIVAAEALLRWKHPNHGIVQPDRFIPISEASGLISPIGKWLLEIVCCQVMRWRRKGLNLQRICLNISTRQFRDDLIAIIKNALETSGLEPECLELEVVETLLLEDNSSNGEILRQLNEMGVRLSIDDFGTGYSSLGYLKRFPFDVLKINRSFIQGLPDNQDDATLVNTIISMGQGLNLEIVAEGVETNEQLEYLRSKGCHSAQGFYFSKPLPAHLFEKRLKKSRLD